MSLKAQHYIVRPGNKAVPLIAVDELPHHIRIENIPRIISSLKELAEMTYAGEAFDRHETYKVVDLNKDIGRSLAFARAKPTSHVATLESTPAEPEVKAPVSVAKEAVEGSSVPAIEITPIRAASTQTPKVVLPPQTISKMTSSSLSVQPTTKPVASPAEVPEFIPLSLQKKYFGINEYQPEQTISSAQSASLTSSQSPPSKLVPFGDHQPLPEWKNTSQLPLKPIHGKKIYCSYWMSKGECNFAQQGCQFKHIMPDNLEDLNALGYQDIPKWYRDKFGVGSLTAVPGSGAHMRGRALVERPMRYPVLPAILPQRKKRNLPGRSARAANLLELDDGVEIKQGLVSSRYAVLSPTVSSNVATENEGDSESELAGGGKFKKVVRKKVRETVRRKSMASDYESEMIREMEERDGREAAQYAAVAAEYAEKMKKTNKGKGVEKE